MTSDSRLYKPNQKLTFSSSSAEKPQARGILEPWWWPLKSFPVAQPHSGHMGILYSLTWVPPWFQRSVDKGNGHVLHHGCSSAKELKVAPSAGGPLGTVRNKAEAILSNDHLWMIVWFSHIIQTIQTQILPWLYPSDN